VSCRVAYSAPGGERGEDREDREEETGKWRCDGMSKKFADFTLRSNSHFVYLLIKFHQIIKRLKESKVAGRQICRSADMQVSDPL
jgi:hypothetical protein